MTKHDSRPSRFEIRAAALQFLDLNGSVSHTKLQGLNISADPGFWLRYQALKDRERGGPVQKAHKGKPAYCTTFGANFRDHLLCSPHSKNMALVWCGYLWYLPKF